MHAICNRLVEALNGALAMGTAPRRRLPSAASVRKAETRCRRRGQAARQRRALHRHARLADRAPRQRIPAAAAAFRRSCNKRPRR